MDALTLHSFWSSDEFLFTLFITVGVFLAIIIALFAILFFWRLYAIRDRDEHERREATMEELVFSYLDDEISLDKIKDFLKENDYLISDYSIFCRRLLKDLEGHLKLKIQRTLNIEIIQNHYLRKLASSDIGKIADALYFYRRCKYVPSTVIQKIKKLIDHDNVNIAFAAALALVEEEKLETQFYALHYIIERSDLTKISVLEILLIFSDTSETDFSIRGEKMLELLLSDATTEKYKPTLAKAMGEISYMQQAPALYQLLKEELGEETKNEMLICALIETLGELFYQELLPVIHKIVHNSDSGPLKISCAKALGALQGQKSIQLLYHLIEDEDQEVRYETMLQMLEIGEPVLEELPEMDQQQHSSEREDILQEIKELKKYRYG